MTVSTMQHSALPEFEDELEGEDEYEGEEFDLGGVISGLLGESELEGEDEDEFEYEGESEYEDEWEGEFEDEGEAMANPLRRVYPDAMMEHLGHAAAEAETEAEAEAFVGALVPLAAGLARKAAPHVAKATPHLVRGLSKVTHTLRRQPATRQLVRTLPTIAARTTRSLARQVAHGQHITPRRAIRTLAKQTAAVLRDPHTRHRVVRHARALDRNYHHATRTGQWWRGMPGGSVTAVRSLAPRPVTGGAPAPVRYGYGQPGRYRYRYGYGQPVRYRYGQPVRYGTPVQYGVPARGRAPVRRAAPVRYGTPARRVQGQPLPARGYPRQRRLPAGLSIAWVPVPAWKGSAPPPGAYRY
jgi:hypothetical protein